MTNEQLQSSTVLLVSDNNDENHELVGLKLKHFQDEPSVNIVNGILVNDTNDDPKDKKLLRKLDLYIIPTMTLLYLLSFLDRVLLNQACFQESTTIYEAGIKDVKFRGVDFPSDRPKFLTESECNRVIVCLRTDAGPGAGEHFSWAQVGSTFLDWKLYVWSLCGITITIPFLSLGFFSPTIIANLGFVTYQA
ncbi:unnamed protein product [Rotaria sordida]|uniref:Uncharacterized protein n=1 Tax=Rotaria sordida TaxID=392033 RepID=A0A814XS97_9BILA|nr:unnamed protein product [Rotaria sordida]CAF1499473.1 unnamed protein product [Rotaria sordida]